MMKRVTLVALLTLLGLLLLGSGPPEPGEGCRTNVILPDGTGICEFGVDPETGEVIAQGPLVTCTLTANRPNGRHGRVIGSGSLYCSGNPDRMRLEVRVERKVLGFHWITVKAVKTGWVHNVNYLGRTVNAACVTGTHQYRTLAIGAMRKGTFTHESGVTNSGSITYTC